MFVLEHKRPDGTWEKVLGKTDRNELLEMTQSAPDDYRIREVNLPTGLDPDYFMELDAKRRAACIARRKERKK